MSLIVHVVRLRDGWGNRACNLAERNRRALKSVCCCLSTTLENSVLAHVVLQHTKHEFMN